MKPTIAHLTLLATILALAAFSIGCDAAPLGEHPANETLLQDAPEDVGDSKQLEDGEKEEGEEEGVKSSTE